ncbi:MAG: TetR/AcrR family transcriptional regulator [Lachnospiraceae bacterium]|nr:TetR/AcrR family transcriptional regulator [Lachnospiraceae bacterium]
MKTERKTDRRTLYTINVIKDAFLKEIKDVGYRKISVKRICEAAEISRATFYLHYDDVNAVLDDVIDDALLFSEQGTGTVLDLVDIIQSGRIQDIKENESVLPACQRIADSDLYHDLFMDVALSDYIISRIYQHEKSIVVPELIKKTGISEEYANLFFRFMLNGSFYVNRSLGWEKNEKWYQFQKMLSVFLDAGMEELTK